MVMRYHLRTLLILLAVGPMILAGAWLVYWRYSAPPLKHYGGGAGPAELRILDD